jgi:exopolysaccharide biosynthesis polyprenyl glycosylphosphotransferase
MTPISSTSIYDEAPEAQAPDFVLPKRDVREALDAAVKRGWSENARRVIRIACLLANDTVAGLAGIATVVSTWWLMDAGGLRPAPNTIPLLAMVFCIQPLALRATGAYSGGLARVSLGRVAGGLIIAAFVGWAQVQLFGRISPDLPNKTAYLYSATLIALYAWLGRLAIEQGVRLAFRASVFQRRVLLIGHRDDIADVQKRVDHDHASDIRVVGAISPSRLLSGGMEELNAAIQGSGAHGVVVAGSLPHELLESVLARCFASGVNVALLPGSVQSLGAAHFELRRTKLGLLLNVHPLRLGPPQLAVKRTMDVLLTIAGLAVTWPVFVLVAIAIKLESPGPVFFRQRRIGLGGRTFKMLKFRTMHVGADAMKSGLAHLNVSGDSRLFKIPNDPRITRVGRLLRRTSLDELPQVFNVLRGEMSLVGPRPFFRVDLAAYESHHFERLHVLPGMTGLWQVSGRSGVMDFEEVIRLDREYIRHWSILTDLWILLRTLPATFGRGAY